MPEALAGLWGVIYLTVFVVLTSAVMRAHAAKSPGNWQSDFLCEFSSCLRGEALVSRHKSSVF